MLAAALSSSLAPLLVALLGSGGLMGAFLALVKLRGDATGQAIDQARAASEVMEDALNAAVREADYWERRYRECHEARAGLLAELANLRADRSSDRPPKEGAR